MKMKLLSLLMSVSFIAACDDGSNVSIDQGAKAPVSVESTDAKGKSEYQTLDQYLEVLKDNNRMAGSIAIYKNGNLDYDKTFIVEDSQLVESDEDYKYKIGSISKTFTAVLVFQLIEEGKLSLDTKLATFFPKVINAENISIQQMLNHHSGISNYTNAEDFMSYYSETQTNQQMVERIEKLPAVFEPGEKGEYSNSNYLLLGYIIESLTGKDYGEVVAEKIAKPLGLQSTYLESVTEPEKNEVFSYHYNESWTKVPQWDMSTADAAGAIASTTTDLNFFYKALFDGKLISENSLKIMIKQTDDFGHGIFARNFEVDGKDHKGYWHNGRIENFSSYMIYFPEEETGIAMFTNGLNFDGQKLGKNIMQAAFGGEIKIPEFKTIELSEDELKVFVGAYKSDTHPLGIKVSIDEGKLFAQADGQGAFPLNALEVDTFEYPAAAITIKFNSDENQFVIKQGGRADIFSKNNGKKPKGKMVDLKILESYVGVYASDNFPLDIEIMMKDKDLYAQATGQPEFPLTVVSDTEFKFDLAGINIKFDAEKNQLTIIQGGNVTVMDKKRG